MTTNRLSWLLVLFFRAVLAPVITPGDAAQTARESWPFEIATCHRPGSYFWSPGSAWDEANIQYNLEKYHQAGIGTLHIVPIYGARGAEDRTIKFLSPQWMNMLDFLVRKARDLGMQIDMTTGTGWCFGGPGLDRRTADLEASYDVNAGGLTFATRRMVKRAAPGGAGHMLNPYSPAAMRFYLERFNRAFDRALHGAQPAMPRAQYHDSFEYNGNWSDGLPGAFQQRHGYDLAEHLETLFGEQGAGARIKYDYRVVLGDLHYQTMKTWADWARSRGMVTRNQAHGSPSNLIDTYAVCDIPETEMFGAPDYPIPGFRRNPEMVRQADADLRICMLPASAAHIAHPPGKQLVSSESCTWLREHWHTTLGHAKLELDELFLAGVNHVFYHGSCYSPKEAPWPGWFFYASTKFDWRNAFWRDFPILNAYVARCQSVLQAGQPDNDLLLYWPIHDFWMRTEGTRLSFTVHHAAWMEDQPVGKVANLLMRQGYAFDFISDRLLHGIEPRDGKLHATGGTYRAIIVPRCHTIPAATLAKLAELAEQGATVIFQQQFPEDVPGLGRLQERRGQFATARARLRKTDPVVAADLAASLRKHEIPRETMTKAGLKYIRRKVEEEVYYFIANQTAKPYDGWLALARPMTAATLLDPMTGESGQLTVRNRDKRSQVYLQLAPGESRIVRICPSPAGAGRQWDSLVPKGEPFLLDRPWQVEFVQGEPALPASYQVDRLASWTEAPDREAQRFAGTACYQTTFDLPTGTQADDWYLDLGEVRESARVRINGQNVGALIALPMRLRVGEHIQPGKNRLEIEVTNMSANRLRDLDRRGVDWKIMKEINIVTVHYQKIEPATWPLEPSGLLGPVRLLPMARLEHGAR